MSEKQIYILYENYKDERALRRVEPRGLRFGTSPWHPEPQWLLDVFDLDKGVERTFAMSHVLNWATRPPTPVGPED